MKKIKSIVLASAFLIASAAIVSSPLSANAANAGSDDKPAPKGSAKAPEKKKKTLGVGDPAPALTVNKWVKGEPVASLEKGKAYVVEFWATWCPPCRKAIPHLSELQKKRTDITFIGVAASERSGLSTVEKFVTDQGDKMSYRVAFADDNKAITDWMTAAGQDGIPTAFVVDAEGKIAWIGSPFQLESHLPKAPSEKPKATESESAPKKTEGADKAPAEGQPTTGSGKK